MNKKTLIIVVVLVVLALLYWLSSIEPVNTNDSGAQNEVETSAPVAQINVVKKGPLGIASNSSGDFLVDKNGLTLYVNAKDATQTSTNLKTTCNIECEKTWLPYLFEAVDPGITKSTDPLLSKVNIFTRSDGKQQYALGNQPLYRNVADSKLGDVNGNFTNDWMVARP